MPFSAKPSSKPSAQDWAARAPVAATPAPRGARPWEAHDPKAAASKAFNLRLNDYELQLLRAVSDAEFCSQQALAKRILVRALEKAAQDIK